MCISQTLYPAPDYSLLKNYKIIVLGEKHGDPEATQIETEIVQQFASQKPRLLLEGPFELNFRLNKFLYTDTVSPFSNLNPHKTALFELAREYRYPLHLIDIPRYHFLQNDETYALMSGCYFNNKQLRSAETFLEMRYFSGITKLYDKKLLREFLENYETEKNQYSCMAQDSSLFREFVNSIYSLDSAKAETRSMDPLWSNARDRFMYLQVKKEHEKNSEPLIVITGAAHALREPYAPIKKNWTPMAASLTTQYKEKICTVFLWKRGTLFPIYVSKKTKKQLLKITQKGEKRLLDVNREKDRMPELVGKYTYLLVY